MNIVKRTKTTAGIAPSTATHYAAAVAPAGNVTKLTASRAKACDVPDELWAKVLAYHADRPEAGTVTREPLDPPKAAPAPKAAEKVAEPKKNDPPKDAPKG